MVKEHAQILINGREATLERLLGLVLHNGQEISQPVILKNRDR